MIVADLIEELKKYPKEMLVLVPSLETENEYSTIQDVSVKQISFEHSDESVELIDAIILDEC